MRDCLLVEILAEMKTNTKIYFVTADFGSPVIDKIKSEFPDRFINVGIAEQNLINVSCGLALEGFTVYAYAIASFITMRCYEQIRINLAILSQVRPMNVNLIGVGAGYSYVVSGPTHQCLEDLSIMRALPNFEVFSPCDWVTAASVLQYSLKKCYPKYFRLDALPQEQVYQSNNDFSLNDGFTEIFSGDDTCVISTGYMTQRALRVASEFKGNIGVIDFFMLRYFDAEKLKLALNKYKNIITIEEGFIGKGGLDSLILHFLNKHGKKQSFFNLGLADIYNFHIGKRDALHDKSLTGDVELTRIIKLTL